VISGGAGSAGAAFFLSRSISLSAVGEPAADREMDHRKDTVSSSSVTMCASASGGPGAHMLDDLIQLTQSHLERIQQLRGYL